MVFFFAAIAADVDAFVLFHFRSFLSCELSANILHASIWQGAQMFNTIYIYVKKMRTFWWDKTYYVFKP